MHQTRPSSTAAIPKTSLAPLACLSPFGGIQSIFITAGILVTVGAFTLGGSLVPSLGFLGAAVLIICFSFVIERLIRPLVLWGIGRLVYQSLYRLGGVHIANQVARHYASGEQLNSAQFEQLIKGRDKYDAPDAGNHVL